MTKPAAQGKGIASPKQQPAKGIVNPKQQPAKGIGSPKFKQYWQHEQQPAKGILSNVSVSTVSSKQQPAKGILSSVSPKQQPAKGIGSPKQQPAKGIGSPKQQPAKGILSNVSLSTVSSKQQPAKGILSNVSPKQQPAKGIVSPKQQPAKGIVSPKQQPAKGIGSPKQQPAKGIWSNWSPKQQPAAGSSDLNKGSGKFATSTTAAGKKAVDHIKKKETGPSKDEPSPWRDRAGRLKDLVTTQASSIVNRTKEIGRPKKQSASGSSDLKKEAWKFDTSTSGTGKHAVNQIKKETGPSSNDDPSSWRGKLKHLVTTRASSIVYQFPGIIRTGSNSSSEMSSDIEDEEGYILVDSRPRNSVDALVQRVFGDITKESALKQTAIGGGAGFVTGYMVHKVGSTAAMSVAGTFLILQLAQHGGYIKVDWTKVKREMSKAKAKAQEKLKQRRRSLTQKVKYFYEENFFLATGFASGFFLGFFF